ncbi:MAG: LysM peptidoglycan-binding domain-containing protein [Dermatophilaceae bacterium]
MHSSSESTRTVQASPVRVGVVLVAVLIAAVGSASALLVVLRDTVEAVRSPGRVSVDELVVATSAACALVILLWVSLGLALSVAAALPGRTAVGDRLVDAVAPAAVRRWAALLLGVSILSGGVPGAAMAQSTIAVASAGNGSPAAPVAPAPDWVPQIADGRAPAPAPGWTPTPVRALPPVTLTAPRTTHVDQEIREVTVRRGDTLWDLAASHLSADATDAEVADEWHRWFQANRSVIGPDPDLILPGQVLQVPAPTASGGSR